MVLIFRVLRSHVVSSPFVISLSDVSVKILDELLDARQVIRGKLFHVIVAGAIDVVGRILVFRLLVQLLSVIKWYNLVAFTMDDVNWTLYVGHAVDVREFIARQRPSQVENDTKSRHQP